MLSSQQTSSILFHSIRILFYSILFYSILRVIIVRARSVLGAKVELLIFKIFDLESVLRVFFLFSSYMDTCICKVLTHVSGGGGGYLELFGSGCSTGI